MNSSLIADVTIPSFWVGFTLGFLLAVVILLGAGLVIANMPVKEAE